MSALSQVQDQIRSYIQQGIELSRKKIFGANNERLDLVIDTFYKLNPQQRNIVLFSAGGAFTLFMVIGVTLYFAQIRTLSLELNKRFEALHELRSYKLDFQTEEKKFDQLSEAIERKVATLRVKPFFEQIGNAQGVVVEGLTEQKAALPSDNLLSQKFQEVKIEMRLNNISIPKLINFLTEVEKAGNYIKIYDLQIRGRYGTKLYFDAQIKARGYGLNN